MIFRRQVKFSLSAKTISATIALLVLMATPSIAVAGVFAQFNPPNRGMPGRREGGGTRGGCPVAQRTLTALAPANNLGLTLNERPTMYWYVPAGNQSAEFILMDSSDNEVFTTTLSLPGTGGIVSFTLPETAPALELNKDYRWYFSLICNPEDRSADIFVDGWVQRVAANTNLSAALERADLDDRPRLYARAGLWYDALNAIAELRQTQPNSSRFRSQWRSLLEDVDLEALAEEPLSGERSSGVLR